MLFQFKCFQFYFKPNCEGIQMTDATLIKSQVPVVNLTMKIKGIKIYNIAR